MVALIPESSPLYLLWSSTQKSKSSSFIFASFEILANVAYNFCPRNLADRLMTPFPMTSKVLPPEAPLREHEKYSEQIMH